LADREPCGGQRMSGIGHYFTRRYLARMNTRQVARYPQVVSFAFDLITQFIHLGWVIPNPPTSTARSV
jgi:hypothetical protein